jgi:large subunit ribosomal protein L22
VRRADEVLQFSDREVSNEIRKVLASAVANAQHNDEQDPNELFVKACFADEGPTLKRFRPRAKGRATRINKRTCHMTIILDRLSDAELEVVQGREARRTAAGRRRGAATTGAASRRARVERSRQRAAELKGGAAPTTTDTTDTPAETPEAKGLVDLPQGAAWPNEDGSAPEGYTVKGNADSGYYHPEGTRFFNQTDAEFWFRDAADAEAAGFELPPSLRDNDTIDNDEGAN